MRKTRPAVLAVLLIAALWPEPCGMRQGQEEKRRWKRRREVNRVKEEASREADRLRKAERTERRRGREETAKAQPPRRKKASAAHGSGRLGDDSGRIEDGEPVSEEEFSMMEQLGIKCYLVLDEDGTGFLSLFGESMDLKWSDGEIFEEEEGESVPYTIDGDELTMGKDGSFMTFARSEDEAPDRDAEPDYGALLSGLGGAAALRSERMWTTSQFDGADLIDLGTASSSARRASRVRGFHGLHRQPEP